MPRRKTKQTRRRKRPDSVLRQELEAQLQRVAERQRRTLMRAYKDHGGDDETILKLITHYNALHTAVKHLESAGLETEQVQKHLSDVSGLVIQAIKRANVVPESLVPADV